MENETENESPEEGNEISVTRSSTPNKMLYRGLPSEAANTEDGKVRITGHMSTVNDPYKIREFGETFMEQFAPGAFKETLSEDRISVLFEHGHDPLIARRPIAKATALEEDDHGARFDAELYTEASYVADLLPALRAGDFSTSIGFMVQEESWDDRPQRSEMNPEGIPERTITKAKLREFSVVLDPANPNATVQVRSLTDRYTETHGDTTVNVTVVRDGDVSMESDSTPEELAEEQDDRAKPNPFAKKEDEDEDAEGKPKTKKPNPFAKKGEDDTESDEEDEESDEDSATKKKKKARSDNPTEEAQKADATVDAPVETLSKPHPEAVTTTAAKSSEVTEKVIKPSKKDKEKIMSKLMTAAEREARLEAVEVRLAELAEEYEDRSAPEDVETEWDALKAEKAEQERALERIAERRAAVAEKAASPKHVEETRQAPAVHVRPSDDELHSVRELKGLSLEDRQAKAYDNARRIIERSKFTQSTESREANQEHVEKLLDSPYADKLELSTKLMRSSHPRYKTAYTEWINNGGSVGTETRADMAMADANGGYMVPFDLDPTWILTTDGAVNPLRDIARVEKISGTKIRLVTTAGVTVTHDSEGVEVTEGNPTLAAVESNAFRTSAYLPFSFEIDDAAGNLSAQLTSALAEAKMEDEANHFVTATGDGLTGTEGLNELDDVAGSMVDVGTTGSLAASDIYALDDDLAPRHRRNASFLAGKPTYNAIRQLDTAGGADLWVRIGAGNPGELLGYQAREMSDMESQGDSTTNAFLILGDFRKYLIVERIGMITQVDDMVKGTNGLPRGQRAIVAYWWIGGRYIDKNAFRGLKDTP